MFLSCFACHVLLLMSYFSYSAFVAEQSEPIIRNVIVFLIKWRGQCSEASLSTVLFCSLPGGEYACYGMILILENFLFFYFSSELLHSVLYYARNDFLYYFLHDSSYDSLLMLESLYHIDYCERWCSIE
jgi:hypothetical protein